MDPTGAATYRIPLQVPPGVRGLQPELALLYHSRAGNGQLGMGWSLAGLSAITRCPRTRAQDGTAGGVNFGADDRFCLDGQRLVLIGTGRYGGGGSYRTEIESFQDVQAEGSAGSGPLKFTVRDRTGLRREYGASSDSRPLAHNGAARLWLLNKISDRFGNFIQYRYNVAAGEPMLAELSYGNKRAAVASIMFSYQGRSDQISRYIAGEEFAGNQRLTQIITYASGNKVKSYNLSYEQARSSGRSRLVSVTECDPNNDCLDPLRFSWQSGSPGFAANADMSPLPAKMDYLQIADFDNDGIPDYLYASNGAWYLRLGKKPGAAVSTGVRILNGDQPEYALVADMNGDGCADLVTVNNTQGWYLWYSNCNGTLRASQQGYRPAFGAQDAHPLLVDLNGDGYPELVFKYTPDYTGRTVLAYYPSGPGGLAANTTITNLALSKGQKLIPINFFGNGTPDIYVTRADDCDDAIRFGGSGGAPCALSEGALTWNGSTLTQANISATEMVYAKDPLFLDINGDGLTDMLRPQCLSAVRCQWEVYVNRGGSWPWQAVTLAPSNPVNEEATRYAHAVDYNGNGLSDLMYPDTSGRWSVLLSDGKTLGARTDTGLPSAGRQNTLFLDYNGDGLADMLYLDGRWQMRARGGGIQPDLMQQVIQQTNGRAVIQHSISYLPLSDSTWGPILYSGTNGTSNPPVIRHFLGPLYVVRSFASHAGYNPNGAAIYVNSYYRYAGAKLDQQGRGFLGFAVVEAANTNTSIVTRSRYRQDFPYTGMLSQTLQYVSTLSPTGTITSEPQGQRICRLPNGEPELCPTPPPQAANSILDNPPGRLVSQTENTSAADIAPVATSGESRFPYVRSSTVSDYDLNNGALFRKITTSYVYDSHGNPTAVISRGYDATGADIYDVIVSSHYDDDNTANWCLGLANDTQITRNFNGASLTRQSRAAHDSGTCVRTSETSEPGNPALELVTSYGLDDFGNRASTTIRGANIDARTTRTEYGTQGQFPVRLINALGHVETQTWDPAFGNRLSYADPNGITTRWQYDGFGRKVHETAAHNALQTDWGYGWCNGCRRADAAYTLSTASKTGSRSVTEYDSLGRAVFSTHLGPVVNGSAQVINEETHYDPLGRAYLVSRPYFEGTAARCWTYRQYDNLNRLLRELQPANSSECGAGTPTLSSPPAYSGITQYAYNALRTTVTDALGHSSTRVNNLLGKPASVTDADNHSTYYGYDAFGNVTQVTDANGNVTRMAYDLDGHKLESWDPDMGHWSYRYDALGQLTRQTDAKGQTLTQKYDLLGRLVQRTEAEGTSDWKYDIAYGAGIGKLASVTRDDGYAEVIAYDDYGAPTDKVTEIKGQQYWVATTYDQYGRLDSVLYPDISVPDVSQAPKGVPPALHAPASTSSGVFDITWDVSADGVVYHLYRAPDQGAAPAPAGNAREVYSGPQGRYRENLSESGSYRYWLNLCHAQLCGSLYSNAAVAVNAPAAPGSFQVRSDNGGGDGRYTASWNAVNDAAGYTLYQSNQAGVLGAAVYSGGDPSHPLILEDGSYYYQVRACTQTGCSPYTTSNDVVRVLRQPGTPALSAPAGSADGRYTVSWSAPADTAHVKFYQLQEAAGPGFESAITTTENASATGHVFSHPASGNAPYYYRIRACNQDSVTSDCGSYSNTATVKIVPPPGTPTDLSIPASSSTGNFRISWSAGTGGKPESYTVNGTTDVCEYDYETRRDNCWRLPGGGDYTVSTAYVDISGLREGTYYYTVRACNSSGCSPATAPAGIKVALAPGAPSGLTASVSYSTDGNYSLSWGLAPGSPRSYQLFEAGTADFGNQVSVHDANAMSWNANRKSPNGTYYYRARACNAAGCGPYTSPVSVQVNVVAPPGAPINFSMPASSTTGNFRLSWAAGAGGTPESYDVIRTSETCEYDYETRRNICWNLPNGGSQTVSTAYVDISGLPAGTHQYSVRACNNSGCSAYANAGSVRVTLPPGAPSSISPSVSMTTNGNYNISWGGATGSPSSYQLFESGSAGFDYQTQVYGGSALVWNMSGKSPNGVYYYRARACNSAGCGAYTNGVVVQVAVATPPDKGGCPPRLPVCDWVPDDAMAVTLSPPGEISPLTEANNLLPLALVQPETASTNFGSSRHVQKPTSAALDQEASRLEGRRKHYASATVSAWRSGNAPRTAAPKPAVYHPQGAGLPPLRPDPRIQDHFLDQGGEFPERFELAASSKPVGTYAHMVKYSYDATGHLSDVHEVGTDNRAGTRYWVAADADAAGHITGEVFGNGVARARGYDAANGLLLGVNSGTSNSTLQSEVYKWDSTGKLRARNDEVTGLNETFDYDPLDRLTRVRTTAPNVNDVAEASYDAIGNPQSRSSTGSYAYGGSPYSHAQPHAVRALTLADNTKRSYSYDANGNLTAGAGRSITWTSYDKPKQINAGTTVDFEYAPDRSLMSRSQSDGNGSTYIGQLFEAATQPGGNTEYRMYIYAGDQLVAVHTRTQSGGASIRYPLQDHLGSTVLFSDEQGREVSGSRTSYDAWGRARPTSGPNAYRSPSSGQNLATIPGRPFGYTGHLNMDNLGLVHMGGRLYDPELGRMVSADPNVQFPLSSQGFNRYSYVNNNPLSFTDPSGYFTFGQFAKIVAIAVISYYTAGLATNAWMTATASSSTATGTAAATASTAASTTAGGSSALATSSATASLAAGGGTAGTSAATVTLSGQIIGGATGGFVGGTLSTSTLQGGLNGAFAGAVFGGIDFGYSGQWNLQRVAVHTLAGGAVAEISGGDFLDGARPQFITSSAMLAWNHTRWSTDEGPRRSQSTERNKWGEKLTDGPRPQVCGYSGGNCSKNWLTESGMADEGSHQHWYDENSGYGRFINAVSKPHDWMSSWNYNSNGDFMSWGAAYDSAFQIYSLAAMPVAGAFTAVALMNGLPGVFYEMSTRK